jgi:FkbM family methyltransferase
LLRYRWGQRVFFALYDVYKLWFEAGPIAKLQAYVSKGACVIDVGANVGFFTLRFAHWVGPQGRVIAIEPEDVNFVELTRRISAKNLSNRIAAHHAAADRTKGEARLVVNKDHPGDHQLGDDGIPVHTVTLDGLVASEGRAPALIKIDVQGAEMRVLAGAETVLKLHRPVLFIEVDPGALDRFGTSTDMLLAFLARFDYAPHILENDGAKLLTRLMLDDLLTRRVYVDLLFIAKTAS